MSHGIKRVALLFAGGPAPGANAVISTCAISCIRNGIEVVGIKYGYSNLMEYSPATPLVEGLHYKNLTEVSLRRTRSKEGIIIGTARANPGKQITAPEHLDDAEKSAPLKRVYEALRSIGVDALVSIGGDDTLKTANKLKMYQDRLPEGQKRMPVVHVPKTIDNDYMGIDFTFGYFTAVETLGTEIRNLHADAEAARAYFVVESMGRSAGWLAYGAAISGEANMVLSVEDMTEEFLTADSTPKRKVMDIDKVVGKIVRMMRYRQEKEGKEYGVVVLAEGLAEFLSDEVLKDVPRDDHGHISVANVDLGKMFARRIMAEFTKQTGLKRKVTGLQLGYECRCARPHAFDVMLGAQLGVGAYRALCEENLNGAMVSVSGQLDLHFVPFEKLVDPKTLVTVVRFIKHNSDFHKLARFLESGAPE
ncbi:MAG: 6-phosphofructokinase [Planctomycetota bacterium]|jgi:6-phosphofructokinase 1|nr:MAG: 6-phosphofructokinase [Planctomycetota bacterium]